MGQTGGLPHPIALILGIIGCIYLTFAAVLWWQDRQRTR